MTQLMGLMGDTTQALEDAPRVLEEGAPAVPREEAHPLVFDSADLTATERLIVDTEFGERVVQRPYTYTGAPLMDSFYFAMARDRSLSPPIDHELQQIECLLDTPHSGTASFGFHDESANDGFFFKVAHHSVSPPRPGPWIVRGAKGDLAYAALGSVTVPLDRPSASHVFVLTGFRMAFHGADHNVDEIGIQEGDGFLTIHYGDQNGDDAFLWHVQYAYVPASLFARIGDSHGSRARGGQRRTIGSGKSVIRGFHVNFHPYFTDGSDHHIRELGVLTPDDGRVEVFYSDHNADDGFDWSVSWAILKDESMFGERVGADAGIQV